MYGVEFYAALWLAVVEEGLSHHEAVCRFGIDRRTVKKMLSYWAPPGCWRRTCRSCSGTRCQWQTKTRHLW